MDERRRKRMKGGSGEKQENKFERKERGDTGRGRGKKMNEGGREGKGREEKGGRERKKGCRKECRSQTNKRKKGTVFW